MKLIIGLAACIACVAAIPVDNGVQGEPEIECGPTSIIVTFNTENQFEGHVYVKNLFDRKDDGCRTSGDGSRSIGQIELPHFQGEDGCNVERVRSADPKGIFVRTTVVISFHPRFLTKVDRAYTIQCFYMEADKTVSTDIEVSMITTGFQTQFVPMPVCRYEILDSPSGNAVQFAIIGQPVYHKWTCDTDTVDTFCMTVHSCFVDDGSGDRLDLVDPNGCATDRYLMDNVEYPTDLMAVKEVHVFKYADRPALQFQCQITIDVKEPNADCIRPECEQPFGGGDGDGRPPFRRFQRSTSQQYGIMDVATGFESLDISPDMPKTPLTLTRPVLSTTVTDGMCLSTGTAYALVLFVAALTVLGVAGVVCTASRRK